MFMLDGLTFLWVRRAYNLAYHLFIHLGGCVILFDIDNLKEINDHFGHPMGDHVLRKVGLILLTESRFRAFRYGGDELAILLLFATKEQAEGLAGRARRRIADINIDGVRTSISVGIGLNEEEADRALYRDKTEKPR